MATRRQRRHDCRRYTIAAQHTVAVIQYSGLSPLGRQEVVRNANIGHDDVSMGMILRN